MLILKKLNKMIKKIAVAIVFLSTITLSFGQEIILEFPNSLKTSSSKIKDVIPIVNKENDNMSIFIADAKNVYAYKFDKDFKLLEKLISKEKRRKFKLLVGNSVAKNGDYTVYLTNKKKNKFLSVRFSFENKKTESKEFNLKSQEEKFIQTVSKNNKFYLISARQDIGELYVYAFDDNENYKVNRIDLSNLKYKSNSKKDVSVPSLLVSRISVPSLFLTVNKDINKIDEDLPNSIEIVAEKEKMYVRDNAIIFTFDGNNDITQTLKIDLDTFKASGNTYKKPLEDIKSTKKKSNSFINGDYIFLSATNKEKLVFRIANFKTGEVIKDYKILRDEPISFKNTPIIQVGGAYVNYREMEKTKKFLRKINKDKFGISARKLNSKYQATIGGYALKASPAGGMFMGGFGGIPVVSAGNVSVFFNPAMFAYNSMSNTRSIRIKCLFDESFNHIGGEVGKNVFEKIKDSKVGSIQGETVFKYKDYYIRGYYSPQTNKYFLTKFVED